MCHIVPATPVSDVCAVYDLVKGTLQTIESTWNELVSWGQSACCSHLLTLAKTIDYCWFE